MSRSDSYPYPGLALRRSGHMRRCALRSVSRGLLVAAAALALLGFGGAPGSATRPATLGQLAERAAAVGSLRFELTARIERAGLPPYVLRVRGATSRYATWLRLAVDTVRAANGTAVPGATAEERVDRSFVYVRSTATRAVVGPMWVRERRAALGPGSAELRLLHHVSAEAVLDALRRGRGVTRSDGGRVYHASLPYGNPGVRVALEDLEGGIEYRHLRLTAWVAPSGLLRLVLVTGRTADGSSTFLLTLELRGYGRPVSVGPPGQRSFIDFDLVRLAA